MRVGSSSSVVVTCHANQLPKVENFVDAVCEKHNIFNIYFGNILGATTEFFSLLCLVCPAKEVHVFSEHDKGSLVVGFKLGENFLDVAAIVQKSAKAFLDARVIGRKEKSYLAAYLLTDNINLDNNQEIVKLAFHLKSLGSEQIKHRGMLIEQYLNAITVKNKV